MIDSKNTSLKTDNAIKPIIKSNRNKSYIALSAILLSIFTVAAIAYAKKNHTNNDSQVDSHQNKESEKIENNAPKKFEIHPQVNFHNNEEKIIPKQEQASSTNTTDENANSKADLYDAPLCKNCDTSKVNNTQNIALFSQDRNNDNQEYKIQTNNNQNNFKELEPVKLQGSKASIVHNQEFIIVKGTFLHAILETKIDSSLKGMVSAILTKNIYSMDGSILLLEKGSKITGQYASDLKEGAERLMVVWERIITPNGIMIDINSLGTDSLGGSGFDGQVNHQYAKRFGSALLLSIIDDSFSALSKKSNITNNIENTQQQTRSIAEQALTNSINIAPILYKNPGEYINIFISRDLDFSDVYQLQIKK